MIGVDWVFELWKRIGTTRRPIELNDFRALVAEHCPFKDGVPYLPVVATGNLGQDMFDALNAREYWKATMLAVSRNDELYGENVEMKKKNDKLKGLLHETYRNHVIGCATLGDGPCDCGSALCPVNAANDRACSCGADEWNARVDEALRG